MQDVREEIAKGNRNSRGDPKMRVSGNHFSHGITPKGDHLD